MSQTQINQSHNNYTLRPKKERIRLVDHLLLLGTPLLRERRKQFELTELFEA